MLPVIDALAPKLAAFSAWASENPELLKVVVGGLAAVAAAIVLINVALALNPFALIAGAVVGLGALLVVAYKQFGPFRAVVDAVFGAIKFGVTKIAIPYINLLLDVWKTVFNAIGSIWNNTLGKISFEVPDWVPGLGGKGFSFPKIPALAEGGIVNAPTLALIGEAGPEAVIPLDRMGGMGGNNVTINVQGGDPNAVVDALRRYMQVNGSVPIRVNA
jgi:hypothetical protein